MKRRQGRKGAGRGRRHDLLLLLSPAAWTCRRRGGAGAHDPLGIEQGREEEACCERIWAGGWLQRSGWVDGSRGGFGEWVAAADPRRGKAVGGGG